MPIAVANAFSSAYPSPRLRLVQRVVEPFGNTHDEELKALALDLLDETIKEYNTSLYEFNKLRVTNITLVDGTESYTMPSLFYRESIAWLVRTSGQREPPLTYLPMPQYEREYRSSYLYVSSGRPMVYSMFNTHREGSLYLSPVPDATTAADFTLSVEYYRRLPLVSSEDPMQVPQEIEVPLLYGAQKRMAIHLNGAGDQDVAAFNALEGQSLERLKVMDRRHPDEATRFKIVDSRYRVYPAQGTVYIRIR